MHAFGAPGIAPAWAAGDKDTVGTALGTSRVWFTIGGGVLNEVFWPNTGRPQLRDLGFLVTGDDFWVEVKRNADYAITMPSPTVPLPTIVHRHERFTLTLMVVADPRRDVVLVRYELDEVIGPDGSPGSLRLHVLASPHLGGTGHDNTAWTDRAELFARNGDEVLAVVDRAGFVWTSVGFVGASDAWQDLHRNGELTWTFDRAEQGNVALAATPRDLCGTLALAFAGTATGARSLARGSLTEGFDAAASTFETGWTQWAAPLRLGKVSPELDELAHLSAMVLRVHEDLAFPGAIVASLSTPWGFIHDDPGGYHLVWPRDCAETGLALSAIGLTDDARRVLHHLAATQSHDGDWPQNFTPDGVPFWKGRQLDETALPVLLAMKLHELDALHESDRAPMVRMIRRAVGHLVRNGPLSDQDRWEETAGANPFTLAVAIAALAAAALSGWLPDDEAAYALEVADWWNASVEDLVYAHGGELARRNGVPGNYVRVCPANADPSSASLMLANRGGETYRVADLVGLEFLALVRHGLRAASDPRVVDTVAVVDATLRVELRGHPYFHRYQDDGYGEHTDGSPFDGSGIGRAWPLLAGERGHYAIGHGEDPLPYLRAMAASTGRGHLIPEQVWDTDAIAQRRLFPGSPSGSAMPLVWAHAEFLKLHSAAVHGVAFDRIAAVAERYATERNTGVAHIRDEPRIVTSATTLVIRWSGPFLLHIGTNGWTSPRDLTSKPSAFGLHEVRVERSAFAEASTLEFTRQHLDTLEWEGHDHVVTLA